MNIKKIVSAVTAFALSASVFAGFGVTASAASAEATLVHTGHLTYGASVPTGVSTSYDSTDGKEYYNSYNTNGNWGQAAYAQFSLNGVEDVALEDVNVMTFTFTMTGLEKDANANVYYESADFPALDSAEFVPAKIGLGTLIETVYTTKSSAEYTVKITDETVIDALLTDPSKITFAISEKSGGGYIEGKNGTKAPTLTVEALDANTVTYDVKGETTTEMVVAGSTPAEVPTAGNYFSIADKADYTFKGWNKDADTETVYTTEQIKAMTITAAAKFTAVYEKSAWAEDVVYQNTISPITLKNNRSDTYAIGAAVGEGYTIAADVKVDSLSDGDNAHLEVFFRNESSQTVAGLLYRSHADSTTKPGVYFVTAGTQGSSWNSISLDTVGESNYVEIVKEGDANPGEMHVEFTVNEVASTATLSYNGNNYTLPLNNKATTIKELAYGGYRYNAGSIKNIVVKETELYEVAVNVKNADGEALEGVEVSTGSYSATTDASGVAKFTLAAGDYTFNTENTTIDGSLYEAGAATLTVVDTTSTTDLVMNKQTATPAELTLKYVDQNNSVIKEVKATGDAFVNVPYTLTADETATFEHEVDGATYRVTVTTTEVTPTEATATCEIECKADKYVTVAVKAVGDVEKELSTISGYETDTAYYVNPMYILENEVVYEIPNNSSGTYYGGGTTLAEGKNVELTYTKKYENVVLYDELDDTLDSSKATDTRASNGKAKNNAAYTSSIAIEPGIYTIAVRIGDTGRGSIVKVGDTELFVINEETGRTSGTVWKTVEKTGIVVTETSYITLALGEGKSTYDLIDTVVAAKTGELPTLTVAVAETDGETSLPAATEETAIYNADGTSANTTYGELTADMVVKTVYAKVANTEDAPVVSIGGVAQTSAWTEVGDTGIYFAQFVGAESDFAEGGAFETVVITCGDLEESITW